MWRGKSHSCSRIPVGHGQLWIRLRTRTPLAGRVIGQTNKWISMNSWKRTSVPAAFWICHQSQSDKPRTWMLCKALGTASSTNGYHHGGRKSRERIFSLPCRSALCSQNQLVTPKLWNAQCRLCESRERAHPIRRIFRVRCASWWPSWEVVLSLQAAPSAKRVTDIQGLTFAGCTQAQQRISKKRNKTSVVPHHSSTALTTDAPNDWQKTSTEATREWDWVKKLTRFFDRC